MRLSQKQQREIYVRMLRIRLFEERGAELFKAGKIPGAYHSSVGHEATIVGACSALSDNDLMTGTHRSHGHPIGKGADLKALMAELMGRETGICRGLGGSMHLADRRVGVVSESAIVGGGIPIATGCGLSAKVRKTGQVALCFFGDGAVNQGTFHESLNMASLWKLPVIYVCENNGYAITTSLSQSHGQPDITKRGAGYGIPAVRVDGQDVMAVHRVVTDAVNHARSGGGPTLIEAQTYRFDEHNVGLVIPGRPYRTAEEVQSYKASRDPVVLYRQELLQADFDEAALKEMEDSVLSEVADAVKFAEASPHPRPFGRIGSELGLGEEGYTAR